MQNKSHVTNTALNKTKQSYYLKFQNKNFTETNRANRKPRENAFAIDVIQNDPSQVRLNTHWPIFGQCVLSLESECVTVCGSHTLATRRQTERGNVGM